MALRSLKLFYPRNLHAAQFASLCIWHGEHHIPTCRTGCQTSHRWLCGWRSTCRTAHRRLDPLLEPGSKRNNRIHNWKQAQRQETQLEASAATGNTAGSKCSDNTAGSKRKDRKHNWKQAQGHETQLKASAATGNTTAARRCTGSLLVVPALSCRGWEAPAGCCAGYQHRWDTGSVCMPVWGCIWDDVWSAGPLNWQTTWQPFGALSAGGYKASGQ